jgi:hypothetical protein
MDRDEARAMLERTTSFEFRDDRVVLRDLRLLSTVAAIRQQRAEAAQVQRHGLRAPIPTAA